MQNIPAPFQIWQKYIEQGIVPTECLSPIILKSWQRSTAQHINPYRDSTHDHLDQQKLHKRIEACQLLLTSAKPVMQELYNVVKDTGFTVLLADREGYILNATGEPKFMKKAKQVCLSAGANWHEATRGTNAIGTAITAQRAVTVLAWEHFCQENHFLTCSAAPIFDAQGTLLGVLDISGDYHSANRHTLGMVIAAARAIENRLLLEQSKQNLVVTCQQMTTLMETVPQGLLSLDEQGCIIRINQAASSMLGLSADECLGLSLEKIFLRSDHWLDELKTGKRLIEKTVVRSIHPNSPPISYQIKLIGNPGRKFYGATGTIQKTSPKNTVHLFTNQTHYKLNDIIGESPQIAKAKELVRIAAASTSTVLIYGKTGTGKEVFAQSIHNASDRCDGPFVAINCGAIPASLLESELFGYEEGSFTGARKGGQAGKFELANGGTIFLDEISEMPLQFQINLLRVLEERQVVRIGGYKIIPLNIRVIAATNKDLQELTAQGAFRSDLYYRLNVLPILIPSLRERREDILLLSKHLLTKINQRLHKTVQQISPECARQLQNYTWPGNVRELENILERAVNLAQGDILYPEHLPAELNPLLLVDSNHSDQPGLSLKEKERQAIQNALQAAQGNVSRAARNLGIGRTTLYRKVKEFSLNDLN